MLNVTLFTRQGCHLCEQAKKDLENIQETIPHRLVEIDIEQDPQRMRPSDVPTLVADASKFTALSHWQPEITIETTLEQVLNYYREELK